MGVRALSTVGDGGVGLADRGRRTLTELDGLAPEELDALFSSYVLTPCHIIRSVAHRRIALYLPCVLDWHRVIGP